MQFEAPPHGPIQKTAGFINLSAGTYSLERGWNDGPDCSKVTQLCLNDKNDNSESISVEIKNPKGCGLQHRTITIDHRAETVTVQDVVTDFSGNVLFNLPILAKSAVQNENEILADGYYGVKIKITNSLKCRVCCDRVGTAQHRWHRERMITPIFCIFA